MSDNIVNKLSKLDLDNDLEDDQLEMLQEKCGIFGCIANGEWPTPLDVAHIICLGLVGLQHRGQESAGIVTCKWTHEPFSVHRGMGLVSQVFNEPIMMTLKGNLGIGHNRYSTAGGADNIQLAQPFVVHTSYGAIAMAHNGELVNSQTLRERILRNGVGLTTGSDSELITQALSMEPPQQFKQFNYERSNSVNNCDKCSVDHNGHTEHKQSAINPYAQSHMSQKDSDFVARILHLMSLTPLSYSLIVMWDECIYAIRDPFGNRPLCLGALVSSTNQLSTQGLPNKVDGWVVSSESCSFPSVCAKLYRDVLPGEIVKLEKNRKPKTLAIVPRPEAAPPAFCIFEYVYFARPDSMMEGQTVYTVRMKCGQQLAIEAPVNPITNGLTNGETDLGFASDDLIVAPVPETAIPAALGYAQQAKLPYVEVFCKNRYVGRSFIQPSIKLRRLAVAKKFGPLSQNFIGKSIILIEDSIVRGTTIGQLIRLLKDAGAKEVHIRIASPALHFPCYMGINIPTKEELVANHLKAEQLAQTLGAASLVYLSLDGLKKSVQSGIRDEMLKTDPEWEESDLQERIGHCTACLTGQYPVKLSF
ncbi:amidophosphoribosyltransferase-like [Oppia nitens]|uniref:amidophosphoribosyltransferase-like n=1 Tax=Oppia nitens TaxID=1686743 RepID=UPI0023DA0F89|nr:amidophosphoribosyltransferase-like [Oppia nitens]